jgi:hypothetical protein
MRSCFLLVFSSNWSWQRFQVRAYLFLCCPSYSPSLDLCPADKHPPNPCFANRSSYFPTGVLRVPYRNSFRRICSSYRRSRLLATTSSRTQRRKACDPASSLTTLGWTALKRFFCLWAVYLRRPLGASLRGLRAPALFPRSAERVRIPPRYEWPLTSHFAEVYACRILGPLTR